MFNAISLLSIAILLLTLAVQMGGQRHLLIGVCILLISIFAGLFLYVYFAPKHVTSVVVYSAFSYAALVFYYFAITGIEGMTLMLFSLTLVLVAFIPETKDRLMFLFLHVCIAAGFLMLEDFQQLGVLDQYRIVPIRKGQLLLAYLISVTFIFIVSIHIRQYCNGQKEFAEQRELTLIREQQDIFEKYTILEKANQEKDKLFSIISHDLRTPINSILAYLELISEDAVDEQDKGELLSDLAIQTKYTSELISNLLFWSKSQMAVGLPSIVRVNIVDIINEVKPYKVVLAARKGIDLRYHIPEHLHAFADIEMFRIVLRNLINNALKFTKTGGNILVKLIANSDFAEISIHDTGVGIAADRQERIFSCGSSSSYGTSNEKGVGLGLVLCKNLIEQQKGKIWFSSREGEGSSFFFTLPLATS